MMASFLIDHPFPNRLYARALEVSSTFESVKLRPIGAMPGAGATPIWHWVRWTTPASLDRRGE